MLFLCLKIFFARIIDVSLSTIRTLVLVRGKKIVPAIIAFFEVLVWFFAAKEALKTNINSWWVPISYSLGYATGSLIGSFCSSKFIKGVSCVKIVTKKDNHKLLNAIKNSGYGISIIKLKKEKNEPEKEMLFVALNHNNLKNLEEIVNKYAKNSFMVITDTKTVSNGLIK